MPTILDTFARALRAITRACSQSPYICLFGPTWWPTEAYRDASMRDTR
jgi:hypothetical protein